MTFAPSSCPRTDSVNCICTATRIHCILAAPGVQAQVISLAVHRRRSYVELAYYAQCFFRNLSLSPFAGDALHDLDKQVCAI